MPANYCLICFGLCHPKNYRTTQSPAVQEKLKVLSGVFSFATKFICLSCFTKVNRIDAIASKVETLKNDRTALIESLRKKNVEGQRYFEFSYQLLLVPPPPAYVVRPDGYSVCLPPPHYSGHCTDMTETIQKSQSSLSITNVLGLYQHKMAITFVVSMSPAVIFVMEYRWTRSQGRPAPRFCRTTRSFDLIC